MYNENKICNIEENNENVKMWWKKLLIIMKENIEMKEKK